MDNFRDVIDAWLGKDGKPDRKAFAADHGIELSLANVWFHRGSIPSTHWPLTISKAAERGVAGVTLDLLSGFAAAKRPKQASAA